MAMRPIRSTGGLLPSRRVGRVAGPIYEDFKPVHEWRRQDEADTLLVHLPGFKKEEIKVTTENRNIVRARGERLLTVNKWSRFQEDFLVPEYCDMRGIRAKFDEGILSITMPRKIIASVVAPRVNDATPRIRTKQDVETPIQNPRKDQEPSNKIAPGPLAAVLASSAHLEKQGKSLNDSNIRSTEHVDAEKEKEKEKEKPDAPKKFKPRPPLIKASDLDGDIPRVYIPTPSIVDQEKQQERKTSLEQKHGDDDHKPLGKLGKEPIDDKVEKEKVVASSVAEKIIAKSKNVVTNVTSSSSTSAIDHKLGDYKNMVAEGLKGKLGKSEERELLVNMGVATLVIVALGVYVSYTTFGSSSQNP